MALDGRPLPMRDVDWLLGAEVVNGETFGELMRRQIRRHQSSLDADGPPFGLSLGADIVASVRRNAPAEVVPV